MMMMSLSAQCVVSAGVDFLIAGDACAVHEIERLALGHLFVGVEEMDFADDGRALERESCVASDSAAAANDADFHSFCLWDP